MEFKFRIREASGELPPSASAFLNWQLEGDFAVSVHSRKRLSVMSGRRRETNVIEPLNANDLRGDVLERVYSAIAI